MVAYAIREGFIYGFQDFSAAVIPRIAQKTKSSCGEVRGDVAGVLREGFSRSCIKQQVGEIENGKANQRGNGLLSSRR